MEQFNSFLNEIAGVTLTSSQIADFNKFENLLVEWNEAFNLTSITSSVEIKIKHFVDSLTCLKVLSIKENFSMVDVGTGAGFPGIPLKIVMPWIKLTLVESSQKKSGFCRTVVDQLHLADTDVVTMRAEDLGRNVKYRGHFDWAVARAVAELPVLAEYLLPLLKIGGKALAMKGAQIEKEVDNSQNAIEVLGGSFHNQIKFALPQGYGERSLIVIKKVNPTPNNYPRRAGLPSKKPVM